MKIGESVVELAQVGPYHAIFKEAIDIPPETECKIEVYVDDRLTTTRTVFLLWGASVDSRRVDLI